MSFKHSIRVEKEDIDQLNHVNNVVYVRYVQEVAEAHWKSIADSDLQEKVVWVVLRHEIDYKKPAFLHDQVIGETWVGEATGPKMPRTVELKNAAGELLIRAQTVWCALDGKTHRPIRITPDLYMLFK